MRILLVEDDENKRQQLADFLTQEFSAIVTPARSYHSAIEELATFRPDLVLLDMTIPTYDVTSTEPGGRIRVFGGKEILRRMKVKSWVVPVILVTQFETFGEGRSEATLEQLRKELHDDYPENYVGAVYYNAALENWKDALRTFLRKLREDGKVKSRGLEQ